jgi:hypothetical protein
MSEKIEVLRKNILEDKDFRELLKKNTAEALKKVGIDPTSQNVALVRNVIDSIDNLYYAFGEHDRFVT